MSDGPIHFYRAGDAFGQFSNFYPAPIDIGGTLWPTSEHFFQAAKFFTTDPEWAEAVRNAPTPREAARMGRDRSHPIMVDWWDGGARDAAMMLALAAKFGQHEDLYEMLCVTGDRLLVEHTANDSYWGDGGDGSGKNMLGKLLMRLRAVQDSMPAMAELLLGTALTALGWTAPED